MAVARSRLTSSAVIGSVTCVLTTGIAVAVNYATSGGGGRAWIAVGTLTLVAALLPLLLGRPDPAPAPRYQQYRPPGQYGPYGYRPPIRRPQRTVSLGAVLLVLLLLSAAAGGVAYGGTYAANYLFGTERGVDVLVEPARASAGGLTVTVHRVEITRHFTKLGVSASNGNSQSVALPLYGYCTLDTGGNTMRADQFRSKWQDSIAPGQTVSGTILFAGKPATTTATLTFTTVFGPGPASIAVAGIQLHQRTG